MAACSPTAPAAAPCPPPRTPRQSRDRHRRDLARRGESPRDPSACAADISGPSSRGRKSTNRSHLAILPGGQPGYAPMRTLIFHGYLLRGTGSNIYNTSLARALVKLGHDVHLLCQDAGAGQLDFVDAVGRWDEDGRLSSEQIRDPVRCTAYLPDIHGVLPVYVQDEYEGFRAVRFADMTDDELERYLEANVAAVAEVAERVKPDVALANHLVMGPVILARAIGGKVPYAVKVHGSALEYTVRPEPERFLPYAREGLQGANAVLVGSRHTGESLWEVLGDPELPERTRLGPPGVDADTFVPREPEDAAERLEALAGRLEGQSGGRGGGARAPGAVGAPRPRGRGRGRRGGEDVLLE